MRVLLIEPYYGGSHRDWADGYVSSSSHQLDLLTLPAQAWKWRMQGGAVTLARMWGQQKQKYDLILASDMMNLATFRSLTRLPVPHALYFHENQLTYPQNTRQNHGWRYGFINYVSALAADHLYFNSAYHQHAFFEALPKMLKHFYDFNELETIQYLENRASVLPLGIDLRRYDRFRVQRQSDKPLIVWNHRWEADKNPDVFLAVIEQLYEMGFDFEIAIVGENVRHSAPEFDATRQKLATRIVAFGYLPDFASYARLLWQADYVLSTAHQEFFGAAIVEAMYCGCIPILPNRLNYPNLIPLELHPYCLYDQDQQLGTLLIQHLTGNISLKLQTIQAYVAPYDWQVMSKKYDNELNRLAQSPSHPFAFAQE